MVFLQELSSRQHAQGPLREEPATKSAAQAPKLEPLQPLNQELQGATAASGKGADGVKANVGALLLPGCRRLKKRSTR